MQKIIGSQGLEDYTQSNTRAKLTDLVVTRNDFPTARYSIDLNLEKLMYCAMIIVRKNELKNKTSITHDDFIYVSSENFGELTSPMARKEVLTAVDKREIQRNAETALKRIYTKFDNPTMLVKDGDSDEPAKVPMMTYCHYDKATKCIKVRFAKEFFEYFYDLVKKVDEKTKSFSSHELKHIILFNSSYSLRLYRILMSYMWRTSEVTIDLEELRWMLECEDKYKELANFKNRVLNVAQDEINELSNINVSFENVKNGKEVVAIKFIFSMKTEYKEQGHIKFIDKMKKGYLAAAIPFSDDGSHFKAPDRIKHFKPPVKVSPKQISTLVNCKEFLLDYGYFLGNLDEDTSKVIMRTLLTEKLDKLNAHKPIDMDYYFWLQAKRGIITNSNNDKKNDQDTDNQDTDDQD